jgi:uncharacterized protein (DUF427 family)
VALRGETLAASVSPLVLFETSLPPRWYFAREEITGELATNPDARTGCAYKGWASYLDVRVPGRVEPALAWQYGEPLPGMERIRELVCFFNERVELTVDGEVQPQPRTRCSNTDWLKEAHVDERGTKRLGLEPLEER